MNKAFILTLYIGLFTSNTIYTMWMSDDNGICSIFAYKNIAQMHQIASEDKYNIQITSVNNNSSSIHHKDKHGRTPLFYAELPAEVNDYIKKGACVNARDNDGFTPLHTAVTNNKIPMIKALLKHGANPISYDNYGATPFDIACKNKCAKPFEHYGFLFFPHTQNYYSNPYKLLKNNGQLLKQYAKSHIGSTQWNESEKTLQIIFSITEKQSLDRNSYTSSNRGIIINNDGCYFKQVIPEDLIYTFGEKTIKKAKDLMVKRAHVEGMLNIFYRTGDPHLGPDVIRRIKQYSLSNHYETAVMEAAAGHKKCLPILQELLSEELCSPNTLKSPLFNAVQSNNVEAIQLLMNYGAHVEKGMFSDKTPLELAIELGHTECAKALQESLENRLWKLLVNEAPLNKVKALILDSKMNINFYFWNNMTPLSWAANTNKVSFAELFLKHDAIVHKNMLELNPQSDIYKLLKTHYDNQYCCICFEHPVELRNIPCSGKHIEYFMCRDCYYGKIKQINEKTEKKVCPICREDLRNYDKEVL